MVLIIKAPRIIVRLESDSNFKGEGQGDIPCRGESERWPGQSLMARSLRKESRQAVWPEHTGSLSEAPTSKNAGTR